MAIERKIERKWIFSILTFCLSFFGHALLALADPRPTEYVLSRADCKVYRLENKKWIRAVQLPVSQGSRFLGAPHPRDANRVIATIDNARYLFPLSCLTVVTAEPTERHLRSGSRFDVAYRNWNETSLGSTNGRVNLQGLQFGYGYRRRYLPSGRLLVDLVGGGFFARAQIAGGGAGYPVSYATNGRNTLGLWLEPAVLWSDSKAEAAFGLGIPVFLRYGLSWSLPSRAGVSSVALGFGFNLVGSLRRGRNFFETRVGSVHPVENIGFSVHYGRLLSPLDFFE